MRTGRAPNRCWLSVLPGVEAWSSAWKDHAAPKHSHDAYQISLARTGRGTFACRGRRLPCSEGGLVTIESGEVHEAFPGDESTWAFDTLYLDAEAVGRVLGAPDCRPSLAPSTSNDGLLAQNFIRLHHSIVEGVPVIEQEDHLVGFVLGLVVGDRGTTLRPACRTRLHRVREVLDTCPGAGVTLGDLAALADLSPSHLSRSFRREFGLPPHAYLVQARVHRARSLLRRGVPVVDAAADAGFADQAHLTRHFQRLAGVTPGRYRSGSKIVQDRPRPRPYPG